MDQHQLNEKINQVIEHTSQPRKPVRRIWNGSVIFCIENAAKVIFYALFLFYPFT